MRNETGMGKPREAVKGKTGSLSRHLGKGGTLTRLAWLAGILILGLQTISSGLAQINTGSRHFRMGYSIKAFYDVDVKDATAALAIWSKEIAQETKNEVDSQFYEESSVLAQDLLAGRVDLATFRTEEYIRLNKRPDFDAGFTAVRGGRKTQKFYVLVHADSPYLSLKDVRGKKLSLVKDQILGSLFLDVMLAKLGLPQADKYFASVQERGKGSQAVLAVFFKQADVCIANEVNLNTMMELNPQLKHKLRIIETSADFVLGLAVFRPSLPVADRMEIQQTVLALHEKPRGRQVLSLFKTERFELVGPQELESVRRLIGEWEKSKAPR